MKSKFVFSFVLLAMLAFVVSAQAPADHKLKFEKNTHDFGEVKQGEPTQFTFKFTNTGDAAVKLTNVKASCGCTTPTWPREPIAAGATGEIAVKYDSKRIGGFNKSIRVQYENRTDPITLFIKGNVKPTTPVTPVVKAPVVPVKPAINYSVPRGALSFEKMIENIRQITSEEDKELNIRFRNTSKNVVKLIAEKIEADEEVKVVLEHKVLEPGQESSVMVILNGKTMKSLNRPDGYFSKRIVLYTDEAEGARKQLSINGNYKRIFTEAEKSKSPQIEFVTTTVNGGKIIEGEKFEFDYEFSNTGESPLILTSVKPSCGCTTPFWPQGKEIGPGEDEKVAVSFNSRGRMGKQSKSITVRTNDVTNPTIVLKFTVEVVKDPFHAGGMMGGGGKK